MHTHDDDRKLKKQDKTVNNKDIKKNNIKTWHILDYVQLSENELFTFYGKIQKLYRSLCKNVLKKTKHRFLYISVSCKTVLLTGQQFIYLLLAIELLTDGLIFIGSIFNLILTSQCWGASTRFSDLILKTPKGYGSVMREQEKKWRSITKQLLTRFEDNSSFVWPLNGSVALSLRLWATDPSSDQTKLLLFLNRVNKWVLYS